MALNVRASGVSLENANSFVTLDEADAYHDERANSGWVNYGDDDKEAALIRAYDYLSTLNWKENTFITETPEAVKKAHCEAALREIVAPGCLMPDLTKEDYVLSETVDVLNTTYANRKPGTQHTKIKKLIKNYLKGGSGSSIEIIRSA